MDRRDWLLVGAVPRTVYRSVALGLALLHCWVRRFYMSPDGLSYLDLTDAWWQSGDTAINGYWSPLYPWLVGLGLRIAQPEPQWEAPVVHAINFVLFVGAMLAFERFWETAGEEVGHNGWPHWGWQAMGYPIFLWASITLVSVWEVTPDLLVSSLLLLAASQLLKIQRGSRARSRFVVLGLLLGLAYLTKLAMFPVALIFFGIGLFATDFKPQTLSRWALAILVFAAIAAPWAVVLSKTLDQPTLGTASRLNYAWYVNNAPGGGHHWQRGDPRFGVPTHPTRQLAADPPVFEFATPIGGTYPPRFEPTYWHAGLETWFDARLQLAVLAANLGLYLKILLGQQAPWIIAVCLLAFLAGKPHPRAVIGSYVCLALGTVPLLMYALVHVETRFLGAFVVFLAAGVLMGVSWPTLPLARRRASAIVIAAACLALVPVLYDTARWVSKGRQGLMSWSGTETHESWQVALGLKELGIEPGSSVAFIGYRIDAYWARLAGVRVVAELDTRTDPLDPSPQQRFVLGTEPRRPFVTG